jgi:hypothetical protein
VEQAELLEKKYLGQKPTKLEFSKKGEIALKDFDPLFFWSEVWYRHKNNPSFIEQMFDNCFSL